MNKIYGYVRVSTKQQRIERQIKNIEEYAKAKYPNTEIKTIYKDKYTGTTLERDEWKKLLKTAKENDTIIFDEVSRLSRNAKEGFEVYKELYTRGVNLEFIKEPHINTSVYKAALQDKVKMTGTDVDVILKGINEYLMLLVEKQIKIAFEQAQKERDLLSQRVKEGMKNSDKKPGIEKGRKLRIKKAEESKPMIYKFSKDFNGTLNDKELMDWLKLSRNTFYKYKRELKGN